MKKFELALDPGQITALCGGEYRGSQDLRLQSVADPSDADETSIVFWEQEKYFASVRESRAGLIFCVPEGADKLPGRNLILHPRPYFALMRLVAWWLQKSSPGPEPGIHPTAVVDPSAKLGQNVYVGPWVTIGRDCHIGDDVVIEAGCSIGENVAIGRGTKFYPRVRIYPDCVLGSGVILHSGVVIGADGFGFILMDDVQNKIPQIGNVVIGDNVEIGANSAIDRGTLSATFIGEGTKIDNLVQIGHNCRVGKHCILCAQVGLAGSTILGDYVYLGGQVGLAGHLTIGDRAMVGAQAGVTHNIPADARYLGSPAIDAGSYKRIFVSQKHLPEMFHHYLKEKKKNDDKK
jgi:UDP-3-O-[3-hydroxymyristoyl] glucosamine N-acyltransferase